MFKKANVVFHNFRKPYEPLGSELRDLLFKTEREHDQILMSMACKQSPDEAKRDSKPINSADCRVKLISLYNEGMNDQRTTKSKLLIQKARAATRLTEQEIKEWIYNYSRNSRRQGYIAKSPKTPSSSKSHKDQDIYGSSSERLSGRHYVCSETNEAEQKQAADRSDDSRHKRVESVVKDIALKMRTLDELGVPAGLFVSVGCDHQLRVCGTQRCLDWWKHHQTVQENFLAACSNRKNRPQNTVFCSPGQLVEDPKCTVRLLQSKLDEGLEEQNSIKQELNAHGIPASSIASAGSVECLLVSKYKEKELIVAGPRRVCGLHLAPQEPGVLGKIAHLAEVQDEDTARVLSWHMSADMDCVVTNSTEKADEIYQKSDGNHQVMALDSIYRKTLPDWGKPLPHERICPSWSPPGNPIYARNMLHFPDYAEQCKIVFGMLLGDTIIVDTLKNANVYRQEIVKHTHCPTILTRTGDRVRSNGKYGGVMNRALPLEKLRGAIFSEPLPPAYEAVSEQIALIERLVTAMQTHHITLRELNREMFKQSSPEVKRRQQETQHVSPSTKPDTTVPSAGDADLAKSPSSPNSSPSSSPSKSDAAAVRSRPKRSASKIDLPDFDYSFGRKNARKT